ncbi:hypothetical protein HER32_19330 [Hymenobacter sp. BT18]|uniref:hypothetical protein n=1 Tax=Hymenobacter sp. BT18 TaxID=2835648 RepID=UPI00143EAAF2|nr:hypothetical protein [Hymenobacter sp. BT18]QIX63206.1 hypothetical protein HER32_19330 [Hymenobacter sp. BT18]
MQWGLSAYLRLRGRTLGRQVLEVGWWRLALLLPLLLAAVARALTVLASHATAHWLVPLLVLLMLAGTHRRRPDVPFLALSAPCFRGWLAVEYTFLALPAALVLLGFRQASTAGLTLLVAAAVGWMPPAQARAARHRQPAVFRSEALELVGGFRQTGAWFWWLGLLGAAAWGQRYPVVPALAIGGWVLVLAGCYGTPEPWPLLLPALRGPASWLGRRCALALAYYGLTAAPFVWLLGTGATSSGGAAVAALLGAVLVTMVVLARYAFYPNALLVRLTQGLVLAVAVLLTGHPVYPSLLLVAFFGLIWKSRRQLSRFRYD